ncbi:MAG TPA: BON domain-containing protein [Opitutaceae bacterium]|nr:BON domain-containing protein [Opitutaceae bacterium]
MKIHQLIATALISVAAMPLFASSDTDRKIESAAKDSYNYRVLLADHVDVKANDGIVTLTGMVADKDLRDIAADTVSNLPGVVRVDNRITLDPALKEHSDAWIAWKIRYQLLVRASVSNRNTTVDVKNGVVTLTGSAANAAERELVGVYAAEVQGVKSVKNEIAIDIPAAADDRTAAETIDDASITSQVKYALLSHKSTSALKTKVSTKDGVVMLTGIAANDAEKSLAGKLALSIRGVKSVTNDMTVKN